ncbi:tyrosine-protein phosphatase [Actibacterium ureilyticum]|uniref:phosphatase domain-containing protein n=1 Tax=Actibacterium ureilyticum TaxID=1590614 RepID=UPI000BAAC243|nr:tyrosine-protein phosphatase [Actibacterium ureilyticum]
MFTQLKSHLRRLDRRLRDSFGNDITTPAGRRAAYLHFNLMDHAFLRVLWTNMAQIAPGVWRSNQPGPARLRRYRDMGIRTVISLRGDSTKSHHLLEQEACEELGIDLWVTALNARQAPRRKKLLELLDFFDRVEKPFLMHCKSGSDRAGLAAALYLMHVEGQPVEVAAKQLSIRFLHLKNAPTGILDHMLDMYAADTAQTPMPIRQWIVERYSPAKLTESFAQWRGKAD